jgi:hypothetical protein
MGTIIFLSITNLPFFLYYGIGFAFLNATVHGEIVSQMYAYDWIPFYSISVLTLVEMVTILSKKNEKHTGHLERVIGTELEVWCGGWDLNPQSGGDVTRNSPFFTPFWTI